MPIAPHTRDNFGTSFARGYPRFFAHYPTLIARVAFTPAIIDGLHRVRFQGTLGLAEIFRGEVVCCPS